MCVLLSFYLLPRHSQASLQNDDWEEELEAEDEEDLEEVKHADKTG